MTEDTTKAGRGNINAQNVQGAIVGIGGQQTFQGAVTITVRDMTQAIQASPTGSADAKAELTRLLEQLRQELQQVPAEQAPAAQEVATRAEAVVGAATKEQPDKQDVEYQGNRLKQAAEQIKGVMPTVLEIAGGIVRYAAQFAG